MAPVRKHARTRMRAKVTPRSSISETQGTQQQPNSDYAGIVAQDDGSAFSTFAQNKKDKRQMRHSALLHRIAKTAPGSKVKKRRRPGKKLSTNLDGLLGALPDVEDDRQDAGGDGDGDGDDWEGITDDEDTSAVKLPAELARIATVKRRKRNEAAAAKMEMKSIKSRPGAMKKKAKMERVEKDRFARNMAQMTPATTAGTAKLTSTDRWSSLRNFIGQTMQQNPMFKSGP